MNDAVAPYRLLIWLGAALGSWAVVIGVCLFLPEALAGLAVAGVVLWRTGQRSVDVPGRHEEVRGLVAHSA